MIARTRVARAVASVFLASALVVGTAGCTFITPQATLNRYDPTDGVQGNVGSVHLRNVVGIITEDGNAINLMMTIVNSGSKNAQLNIQFTSGGEPTTVTKQVKARSTVNFGTVADETQIVVLNPDVPAGSLIPVYVQYGEHEGEQLLVPVLEATGIYSELAPLTPVE